MSNVTVQATAHGVGIALKRASAIAGRQVVGRSLQPIVGSILFLIYALVESLEFIKFKRDANNI